MRLLDAARAVLDGAVEAGAVPGLVGAAVDPDGRFDTHAAGVTREGGAPVRPSTRFDLASLTKVVATLPCLLRLVSDGALALDERLAERFANAGWFQTPSLADTKVEALLTHTAGLPAWQPLFARVGDRRTALAAVLQAPLSSVGRVRYSDLGFMLLGALVERVSGRRLDDAARALVYAPLRLDGLRFGPLADDVAASEVCGWRGRLLAGEVHDENAVVWDGIAGHAGLFGDAAALAGYAAAWLRADPVLASPELLRRAVTPSARGEDGSVRGFGWLLPSAGVFAGDTARGFGHTGFTGTSLWIDPEAGVASLLLTNRVHPHRAARDGIQGLRRRFHAAVHGGTR